MREQWLKMLNETASELPVTQLQQYFGFIFVHTPQTHHCKLEKLLCFNFFGVSHFMHSYMFFSFSFLYRSKPNQRTFFCFFVHYKYSMSHSTLAPYTVPMCRISHSSFRLWWNFSLLFDFISFLYLRRKKTRDSVQNPGLFRTKKKSSRYKYTQPCFVCLSTIVL